MFNIGDKQRLDREDKLSTQLPRQMMKTADERIMNTEREAEEFSKDDNREGGDEINDFIFDEILAAIQRRMI